MVAASGGFDLVSCLKFYIQVIRSIDMDMKREPRAAGQKGKENRNAVGGDRLTITEKMMELS